MTEYDLTYCNVSEDFFKIKQINTQSLQVQDLTSLLCCFTSNSVLCFGKKFNILKISFSYTCILKIFVCMNMNLLLEAHFSSVWGNICFGCSLCLWSNFLYTDKCCGCVKYQIPSLEWLVYRVWLRSVKIYIFVI